MNERIRALADEAEFSVKDLHIQGDNFQKFAELIVKEVVEECATICVQHAGWTPRMIAEQVTQHFGVK